MQELNGAPLQLRRLRQLLQGAPPRGAPRHPARAPRARASSTAPNRAEVLGDLNPARRVPTLVLDDGRPLAESNAILWYLGDGTEYVPDDRYERAQVLQWQFFEQYQHEPSIAVVRFLIAYSGEAEKHAERIEEQTANGYVALDAMERHLAGRTFLVGERYTIADISLYAYTHVAHEGGFDLAPYPAIRAWLERVAGAARATSRSTRERCRSASASRRARPARSISAMRSAPWPTERSPTSTAARSCCGSTTPIPERTVPGGEAAILGRSRLARRRLGRGADQAERTGGAPRRGGGARARKRGRFRTRTGRSASPGRHWPVQTARATYQLATVVDDLDLAITHIIRGSDHRPNEEVQQRIARALGGELPEVIHHGLLLGDDGKKLSKRAAHASVADLRDEGIPAAAVRAYLDELGLPRHDVQPRSRRASSDSRSTRSPRCPTPSWPRPPGPLPSSRALCAGPARWSRRGRSPGRSSRRADVALGEEARADARAVRGARDAQAPERLDEARRPAQSSVS